MSRDNKNGVAFFERLESRTLMSGAHPIEPAVDGNAAGWVNVSQHPLFAPGGPKMADVRQGEVGDCWFLASLSEVVLRDPSLIRQDITQRANGTYDVYFHTSATETVDEHVDGLLPIDKYHWLEYAKLGPDCCTWVAIMEKAPTYFRNQSAAPAYPTISGGWGDEAMAALGGSATEMMPNISSSRELFSTVVAQLSLDRAVTFGTKSSGDGPLVNDHEFSVVATRVTKTGEEDIQVRNPWGSNPNFAPRLDGFGRTDDGFIWVDASKAFPELDEVAGAVV